MPKKTPKTETIKQRSIYVYLPSHEMVADWKGRAKGSKVSISKFVQEHVENSLQQEEDDSFATRSTLLERNRTLEARIAEQEKENRRLSLLTDRLDTELKRYRVQPFLESPDMDKKQYEMRLINLLKEKVSIDENDIYRSLSLDPKDTELVKAIYRQLEELERFGLVETLPNGWRWKG